MIYRNYSAIFHRLRIISRVNDNKIKNPFPRELYHLKAPHRFT